MAQFQVNITITSYGETTIEADTYEQAVEMAQDLVAGDFDFIDGSEDEIEVIKPEQFICQCGADFDNTGDLKHHQYMWHYLQGGN